MIAIDQILEILRNGHWHEVKEVSVKTKLHEFKVEMVTSFLAEYDFLEFDRKKKRIKLAPQLLRFLQKIDDIEQEQGAGEKRRLVGHSFSVKASQYLSDADSLA